MTISDIPQYSYHTNPMKDISNVLAHLADASSMMEDIDHREDETAFCIKRIRLAILSLVAAVKEIHQMEEKDD